MTNDGPVIQWLGDISLNGLFCDPQHALGLRNNLRAVAEELGRCDLRIANWESPLWGDGGVNELKIPRLATVAHAAEATNPLGLDVVLLANNHVYDCLETGFQNTVTLLGKMGAEMLGAGWSEEEAARPLVLERRGMRLGLLNYVGLETHPNLPPDARVFLNLFQEKRALFETSALATETDAVLVHLHWGADEFVRMPMLNQRRIARGLIEAGARVVVGGHSHVFQGHERWKNGYIFHGIGNFLFWPPHAASQCQVPWPRYVREVGVASCLLSECGVHSVSVRHLVQEGLTLRVDETPKRQQWEARLCRVLSLPDRYFARIRAYESFYTHQVRFRIHRMRQAGGFWPWMAGILRRKTRRP